MLPLRTFSLPAASWVVVPLLLAPPPGADAAPPEKPPSFHHVQDPAPEPGPREPVRVYLDCQTMGCDFDFFRTELSWVRWVRDRQDAEVHVLVTSQSTGGGGRLYDVSFQGRRQFVGEEFTLEVHSPADDSQDDRRRRILRTLGLGLARFAATTPVAERLQVRFEAADPDRPEDPETPADPRHDPWDYWVFSTSARAFVTGESQVSFQNFNGSFSAERTTPDWKMELSVRGSYGESRFELPDRTVRSITRSFGSEGLLVMSMGDRWSSGIRARAQKSTFQNLDLSLGLGPALEFSFFPYSESTRRALTAEYSLRVNHFDYTEETLFDQFSETLMEHSALLSLNLRQPWGSVRTTGRLDQFLHDTSKNRMSLSTGVNLRLFRGFSLNVSGSFSRVRNELNIAKQDATEEEVLLRRRQLATNYRYHTSFGITYRFGSIFSDVVNPRMEGGGGGQTVMFF